MMKTLEKKVAIVTGASAGIGKAIAVLYAEEGARVVLSDIAEKNGQEVVDQIKKNGGDATSYIRLTAAILRSNTMPICTAAMNDGGSAVGKRLV